MIAGATNIEKIQEDGRANCGVYTFSIGGKKYITKIVPNDDFDNIKKRLLDIRELQTGSDFLKINHIEDQLSRDGLLIFKHVTGQTLTVDELKNNQHLTTKIIKAL